MLWTSWSWKRDSSLTNYVHSVGYIWQCKLAYHNQLRQWLLQWVYTAWGACCVTWYPNMLLDMELHYHILYFSCPYLVAQYYHSFMCEHVTLFRATTAKDFFLMLQSLSTKMITESIQYYNRTLLWFICEDCIEFGFSDFHTKAGPE